jgi:hypothetical protein
MDYFFLGISESRKFVNHYVISVRTINNTINTDSYPLLANKFIV